LGTNSVNLEGKSLIEDLEEFQDLFSGDDELSVFSDDEDEIDYKVEKDQFYNPIRTDTATGTGEFFPNSVEIELLSLS